MEESMKGEKGKIRSSTFSSFFWWLLFEAAQLLNALSDFQVLKLDRFHFQRASFLCMILLVLLNATSRND